MKNLFIYSLLMFSGLLYGQDTTLFYPINLDDKWGYINSYGDTIIQPTYTWVGTFHDNLARVYLGGRVHDDMGPPLVGGKYGFINKKGKVIIPFKYDNARDFINGVAFVEINSKRKHYFNYISKNGKYIIPNKYGFSNEFDKKNTAHATIFDSKNLIDEYEYRYSGRKGSIENCEHCNGIVRIESHEALGVIDNEGNVIIEPQFTDIRYFPKDSIIKVRKNNLWGLYNYRGELLLEPKYPFIEDFYNGFAILSENGYYGVIDKSGIIVIPISYHKLIKVPSIGIKYINYSDSCYKIVYRVDSFLIERTRFKWLKHSKKIHLRETYTTNKNGNCPKEEGVITWRELRLYITKPKNNPAGR